MIRLKLELPFDFVSGLNDLLRIPDGGPSMRGKMIGIRKSKKAKIARYIAEHIKPGMQLPMWNHAAIIEYNSSGKDCDNVAVGAKYIFDALKDLQIVEDDKKKWICMLAAGSVKVDHKEDRKYVIILASCLDDIVKIFNDEVVSEDQKRKAMLAK